MRQDTIWAHITEICVKYVLRETRLQMMANQIRASIMKLFNVTPIFVKAYWTFLLRKNIATDQLPRAQFFDLVLSHIII